MQITLNITEDSKVELVRNCDTELVQGECCFTDFVFNFPETIKGHAIGEYTKFIEFAECKELGECVKFVDEINGDKYELNEACTSFKKIMVQIVLDRIADGKKITWKTIPFILEFVESVNASSHTVIQAQLLNLAEIKNAWETFVKTNCLRMVYSAAGVPLANTDSDGDTIFYLGENNGDFEYGHYYRCVNIDGACIWQDLTQDPSLEGVANGIREINKNRTMQLWAGTLEELEATPPQGENVLVLPEDADAVQEMKDILSEAVEKNSYIPLDYGAKIPVATPPTLNKLVIVEQDKNKICKIPLQEEITLTVEEELQRSGDMSLYRLTVVGNVYDGAVVSYKGETTSISTLGEAPSFWVPTDGKFKQAGTVTLMINNGYIVIPQRKLLYRYSAGRLVGMTGIFQDVSMPSDRAVEIKFYLKGYGFGNEFYTCKVYPSTGGFTMVLTSQVNENPDAPSMVRHLGYVNFYIQDEVLFCFGYSNTTGNILDIYITEITEIIE